MNPQKISSNLKSLKNHPQCYGKPNYSRSQQPCMFQILSWPDEQELIASQNHYCLNMVQNNQEKQDCKQIKEIEGKTEAIEKQYIKENFTFKPNLNKIKIVENSNPPQIQQEKSNRYEEASKDKLCSYDNHQQCNNQQQKSNRYDGDLCQKKSIMKPHQIQSSLYYYETNNLKRTKSQSAKFETMKQNTLKINQKKLDESKPEDKKILEERKKVLKEFNKHTRQLPNSAFTTYFGKPAFQVYGILSKQKDKKTHNVMPHRQQNRPHSQQSYKGAINKGKSVSHLDTIPRKPLISDYYTNVKVQKTKKPEVLPLPKPDLLNAKRFSSRQEIQKDLEGNCCIKKQEIPNHITYYKAPESKISLMKKNKRKRGLRKTMSNDDGLTYMMTGRESSLLEQIRQKKLRDTRLAFKVTQCYPSKFSENNEGALSSEEYGVNIPAGIKTQRSENAKLVMYSQLY